MPAGAWVVEHLGEVTVGATRRDLVITIVDENGNPVNLTGGSATLQGTSSDTPLVTINSAMTLTDAANGVVTRMGIGSLVTQANLTTAVKKRTTYRLQVRYVDNAAEVDFTSPFSLDWIQDPLQPV